jgi:hypothetical protein
MVEKDIRCVNRRVGFKSHYNGSSKRKSPLAVERLEARWLVNKGKKTLGYLVSRNRIYPACIV